MGNSRALQKATKELTKTKAPSKPRDIIYDPMGQWNHPGQNTRIPGSDITMQGVPYPVYAQPNVGQPQMMYPGQEYMFPGADYVDEYPQMKRGGYMKGLVPMPKPSKKGLASKAYSRSLDATNRLFTENNLFKKPKDKRRKVFDPNAKYYAEGGEQGCPEGYAFNPRTGECIEWNPDIRESYDQPTSFDPVGDVINMNPNDRPEGMSDEEYAQMYNDQVEHEQLHRLQWKNDELKGENKTPLRMPSTVDNEDFGGDHYYNRRNEEVNYLHDYWKNHHPDEAAFIPDDIIYNYETDPAMYQLPWTVEGEARGYEYATHDGMKSLFPKKVYGGVPQFAPGGSAGCPPGSYWNGKKCIKSKQNTVYGKFDVIQNKKPIYTSNPKDPRLKEYNDSLSKYNSSKRNFLFAKKMGLNVSPDIYNSKNQKWLQEKFIKDFKKRNEKILPINYMEFIGNNKKGIKSMAFPVWSNPVQPIILTKETVKNKPKQTNKSLPNKKHHYPTGHDEPIITALPPGKRQVGENEIQILDSKTGRVKTVIEPVYEDMPEVGRLPIKQALIDQPKKDIVRTAPVSNLSQSSAKVYPEYIEEGSEDTQVGMDWVNKPEKYIDWQGVSIPYRLPRFKKPGHGGNLIRKGKQKYINLPTIESRNTAHLERDEYAEGGNYGMPLGTGVSQNFIGNRDEFKVGGIPELPLRDNQINYNAFVNGFDPMTKKQGGGKIDAMTGMMKARLAYANEFGNPAAQRMINLPDNPYQFDDGDTGTHYMASMDNYAVPQIQDENGQLMLGDYGPESNEAMRFDTDEDADYFAEHYKDVSPGFIEAELTDKEIQAYRDGGYIVEDVSIPSLTKAQNGGAAIIGEEYVYKKRPESVYKVNDRGEWQIKNKSTHGKYITIEDPEGTRSKELDRKAIPLFEYKQEQVKKIKQLKNEIKNPKEFVDLADKRTIRATTGQKINPNVDLKSGKYNKTVVDKIVKKAKSAGVDPATMLAIALQETNFGKSDSNLGHMLNKSNSNPYSYIDFYKDKLDEAKRAKINDELLQIQYYNGLGTVTPKTEKNYHGFEMQKIYGVPIPAGGINMRKNPLYGKQIKDLRDNVILQNAYIKGLLNQKQKGGVVSELSKKEIKDLVAQGYIVEDVD